MHAFELNNDVSLGIFHEVFEPEKVICVMNLNRNNIISAFVIS